MHRRLAWNFLLTFNEDANSVTIMIPHGVRASRANIIAERNLFHNFSICLTDEGSKKRSDL